MKIGIVTIISQNYGNRLQNFALQEVLKKLGVKVKTIPISNLKNIKNFIKLIVKTFLNKGCAWEKFDLMIDYSIVTCKTLNVDRYDYFIAGSDQIWNPYFKMNSSRELLGFTKKGQKISYAASIGVEKLPENFTEKFAYYLRDFSKISVREQSSVELITKITKRSDIHYVVDPTLLLSKKDWEKIIKKSKMEIKGDYIVIYFLGEINQDVLECIKKFSINKKYKIFNILLEERNHPGMLGPIEFIKLIMNAKFVITDSFHASIFSIIFNRNFVVFDRPSQKGYGYMGTRLVSLLDTFDLKERLVYDKPDFDKISEKIDFSKAMRILEKRREESINYLISSLGL